MARPREVPHPTVFFHTAPHPAGALRAIVVYCHCDRELPRSCGRSVVHLPCRAHTWPRCSIDTPKRHPPGGTRQIAAGRPVSGSHCRAGRGPPAARRALPVRRRPVAVGRDREPAAVGRRAVVVRIDARICGRAARAVVADRPAPVRSCNPVAHLPVRVARGPDVPLLAVGGVDLCAVLAVWRPSSALLLSAFGTSVLRPLPAVRLLLISLVLVVARSRPVTLVCT